MFARDELRDLLADGRGLGFLQQHNPVVRHVVLRRRKSLEEAGLMKPVAVDIHPREAEPDRWTRLHFGASGKGVETSWKLREAFEEAECFTAAMMARNKGAGFMRSLLLQRICSSVTAGLATAKALGDPKPEARLALADALEDDDDFLLSTEEPPSADEVASLQRLTGLLEEAVAEGDDPKFKVVRHYLLDRGWLQLGCIVFSQYFDPARWVAERFAKDLPDEPIALYAGADKSGVHRNGKFVSAQRDGIKALISLRFSRLESMK